MLLSLYSKLQKLDAIEAEGASAGDTVDDSVVATEETKDDEPDVNSGVASMDLA